jgi:hypothetical protein
MTDLELRQHVSAWHHGRFDDGVAPDRLRGAVLAIPEAAAEPRGPVAHPRRLGRPLILLVAAALLIGALGGAMAIGRLIAVPKPDEVPVNFAGLNPCEVLGFRPTLGEERYRGSLELSDQLEHTTKVTSREFAAIRSGEQLRTVAPPGRCDYAGPDRSRDSAPSSVAYRGFTIEFRVQETRLEEALEIVQLYPVGTQPPTEVEPIGRARVWQACRIRSPQDGLGCDLLFVSADPYFFVIWDHSFGHPEPEPLREIAASVMEVLGGSR